MDMIDVIQDFLGQENPESRLVYRAAQQQQQAEEQEKVQKKKKDALDYKRKQANRLRMDYQKEQIMKMKEEQRWCESLIIKNP